MTKTLPHLHGYIISNLISKVAHVIKNQISRDQGNCKDSQKIWR